uniref:C3H1-type domain-containing protein n=1 Tax=Mycena chlorophos TaxID=658473 RepID=A0ABQ0M177_MYCCL|nr:predicted protein [Mycena chlorophos]
MDADQLQDAFLTLLARVRVPGLEQLTAKNVRNQIAFLDEEIAADEERLAKKRNFRKAWNLFLLRDFSTNPVLTLPNEITIEIFLWYSEETGELPLKLMAVCKHWRDIAVATPALWTGFELRSIRRLRGAELLNAWLPRSAPLPVDFDVQFRGSEAYAQATYEAMAAHSSRWGCIQLSNAPPAIVDQLSGPFPALQPLDLHVSERASDGLAMAAQGHAPIFAPKLRTLRFSPARIALSGLLPSLPLGQVTTLTLSSDSTEELFNILALTQSLEILKLEQGYSMDPRPAPTNALLRLEHLQKLCVSDVRGYAIHLIPHLVLPQLRILKLLYLTDDNGAIIMDLVERSQCSVENLVLRRRSNEEFAAIEACIAALPTLTSLAIIGPNCDQFDVNAMCGEMEAGRLLPALKSLTLKRFPQQLNVRAMVDMLRTRAAGVPGTSAITEVKVTPGWPETGWSEVESWMDLYGLTRRGSRTTSPALTINVEIGPSPLSNEHSLYEAMEDGGSGGPYPMTTKDAPWRVKTRPCPFYQQGRCVFEQSCNFVHDISIRPPAAATASSSSSNSLPELLDVLRDVLDPAEDTISMAQEYGVSPHIPGEGWTLITDTKDKDALLSPVSLDVNLARISTIKNNDSIDSGYASDMSFVSPQPLPSTLGLLSSPFGSPTSRMGPPAMGIGIGASRLFSHSPFSPGLVSPLGSAREDSPDLDSPSTVRRLTGVFDVEDEEDSDAQYATAQWNMSNTQLSEPPSRFSSSTLDESDVHLHPDHLHPGSRFSSTTIAPSDDGSDSDSEEPPEDATAQLAYLQNDTINTLYDVYMSPEDRVVEVAAAEEPERGRSIRARVFTPPPRDPKPKFEPEVTSTPSDRSSSKRRVSRVRSLMPPPGPRSVFSVSPDTPSRPLSSMSTRNRVFHPPVENASPESISIPLSATGSGSGKVPFGFRPQSRDSTFQPVSASASQTAFPTHARKSTFGPMSASATQTTFAASPKGYVRKRRISRSAAPPIRDSMASSSRSSFLQESETVMVKGLKSLRLSKVLTAPPSSFSFPDSQSPQGTPTHVSTSSLSAQSTRSAPIRTHTASSSISARSSSSRSGMHHKPQDTLHIAFADPEPTNDNHHRRHHSRAYSRTVPIPMPEPALRSAPADWQTQKPATAAEEDEEGNTIRRRIGTTVPPIQIPPTRATSPTRAASALGFTHPATSTPLPTRLLFAIASDDPEAVRHVLESGDVGAEEMAAVGPEGKSAVRFALENTQLGRRMEIARVLAAFGARVGEEEMEMAGPAMRYFVERAAEEHARRSSALIHRSFFRPLARVRYELVGQDRALEQLFRVLSMHSQRLAVLPVVVLLCGPSGHGKSLLARRFGALLDVPTHTVNMTTLRAAHDLWTALSMGPDDEPSSCTLAEFLINNEGKRCAVILDEIEKVEEKTLWSLLMPWESGRCSFEANSRHVDVRNVVWLGTSNVGTEVIMEHHAKRARPDELMAREEYVQLMKLVREPVSRQMGASILSRVTTVLPFVPFTRAERVAICAEAFQMLGSDALVGVDAAVDLDGLIGEVLDGDAGALYVEEEGARSLYRAVANRLLDL